MKKLQCKKCGKVCYSSWAGGKCPYCGDNSESYCAGLEEYDDLVERLKKGECLKGVPIWKVALAKGLKKAREDYQKEQ